MVKKLIKYDYVYNAGIILDFISKLSKEGKDTKQISRKMVKEFGISLDEFNPLFWMWYFCKGDKEND